MKLTLLPNAFSHSWDGFLKSSARHINYIEENISLPFNPMPEKVMRFLENDISDIRVVILGQDPYPDPKAPTGRSFEVAYLTSWLTPFRQVSLKNMLRLLYAAYGDFDPYTPFSVVKGKIHDGSFPIKPPNELFSHWERQGALMLNAYLTCESGKPGSHRTLWRPFTEELLKYLSKENPQIKYFIWGSDAASFLPFLDRSRCFVSRHPMMCSPGYDDDFLKNPCFKETMAEIRWV